MMKTVKCGMFPGEIKEYAVDENMTVNDVLELAGITTGPEQSIMADGDTVTGSEFAYNYSTITVAKRLKGAIA